MNIADFSDVMVPRKFARAGPDNLSAKAKQDESGERITISVPAFPRTLSTRPE
jgi:hypothetical protein